MASKKKRRKSSRTRSVAANQLGFVGEGLRIVLGWLGALLVALWALLRWVGDSLSQAFAGERARKPLALGLAALSVFLLVALADYEVADSQDNVCGVLGFQLAQALLELFGNGAWVLPACGAIWGLARLFREAQASATAKTVGALVLAVTFSLVSAGLAPDPRPQRFFPAGKGGWIGHHLFPPLYSALGAFGVAVLLGLLAVVATLLATEWAFVPLIREFLQNRRAAQVVQPELPLQPLRKGARARLAEARDDHRRFLGGFRAWLRGAWGLKDPFRPGEDPEEPVPEAAETVEAAEPVDPPAPAPEGRLPGISEGPDIGHTPRPEESARGTSRRRRCQPTLGSLPPLTILRSGRKRDRREMQAEIDALGQRLQATFDSFGLEARVVGAERGPTLTLFEVQLATGVSVKKLKNQREDLAVALGSYGVRIVYPLPGRTTVGIEVPNLKREHVFLKDVFQEVDLSTIKLPMVIGRDTLGKTVVEDLTAMPHMLVAGTTGSGKSVCLNSVLMSLLLTRGPEQLRLILIDPKQVELQLYRDIPHLACPVVTDMKRAPFVLEWATRQMEERLHLFKMAGVRNIHDYNDLGPRELKRRVGEEAYDPDEFMDSMPYVVIVIDELADLMLVSAKEVEIAISRLAAKARAAGVHLLVATQRPSTDVVTGLIKMNLPVRLSFKVTSAVDSRVILDDSGADLLLGNGDFLYRPPGAAGMTRGQGAFVGEQEVREVCDHLRENGKPEFIQELVQMKAGGGDGDVDDPLYEDAVRIILQSGRGSASLLQRALSIGYTRASRLIDIMTEQGVLGPFIGSKAREVLLTVEEWEESRKQPQ